MENKSIKIAACVVTCNRKQKLDKCIKSLLDQRYKDFEIVVIDNASTDGTADMLSLSINNGQVKYFNTGSNLGGAGGFHFAIKKVVNDFDYIWIMDDDTYPEPNALQAFVNHIDIVNNKFGFFSSLAEWINGSACLMNKQNIENDVFSNMKALENSMIPARNASFVSLFIKSENVKKVGLPIKEFFLWGDDTEYTQRLNQFGGYVITDSVVVHDMEANDGVNIIDNDINRIQRYSLFIRNRMFIARLSGKKLEVMRAYISPFKQCFRVLFVAQDHKYKRIKILLTGFLSGLRFSPEIEHF